MILSRVASGAGGTAPVEALSLADAKKHCDVYHDDDDTLITTLVDVARAHMEGADGTGGIVGCAITRHTLDGTLDAFPSARQILLPQPPLVSVTSVKYYDASNALQTLSASSYHVVSHPVTPRIVLASGASWPSTYERPDAVTVRFVVGPAAVPADLAHALRLHVGHLYLNREVAMEKSLTTMPMGYAALVAPHKTHGWV